ncbi:amyloid-beta A4 precursor protein-binding family A member 1 isoform X1 [Anastrepha obliqua]|uniref:amyloid-beta A4 precursor protein-binding family A member 1 isoform X1 n=1 Tax=Anastrepha obliqua TaxID=95512 RepID=UPI002409A7C5|nr:amyloid-beta A4 precursor protein-binding family A member 1 isoform X1 [Anastrepha obliqua]XP_054731400.1 amyloid-beta A4 precursor protein-binding family A member 1 isoform X1 [Anastrepha obliqua]XP_054731401.1 amyloid-beta A4 precursor protein-binding family A member 1 isoform X1 [Anastrepha obliqua]XP_054731402.1 amyloid-beta A4 precursor protein-binding family A member 1 isoform X1 [Anastrepha obliqua]XP_054731403.1 amyloid-beta A4 precursor protein-binding family A member 1 isoform X1 [
MNPDSSELETSNNGRVIYHMPQSAATMGATAMARISGSVVAANNPSTTSSSTMHSVVGSVGGTGSVGTATDVGSDYNLNLNSEMNTPPATSAGKFNEKPQERYVWEMRTRSPNVTPASTVLNSPDLNTDVQYALHHHQHRQHHQIRVGRSPGSQFEQQNVMPQGLASPGGSPTDVGKVGVQCLRDGEIVVFDDIDTNWMNKTNAASMPNAANSGIPYIKNTNDSYASAHHQHNNEDILKVTKMIGQLPIAEYEGSPRRFGNQPQGNMKQAGTSAYPKRPPGFPQRVSPIAGAQLQQQQYSTMQQQLMQQELNARSSQYAQLSLQQQLQQYYTATPSSALATTAAIGTNNYRDNKSMGNLIDIDDGGVPVATVDGAQVKTPAFDYLYECSETRKVLEEFFKANSEDEKRYTDYTESGDDVGSCDTHLEYERERQREREEGKHMEQAYIGQRLARIPKDELNMVHRSPRKQPCESVYNENNDIELYIDSNSRSSGDLADTELEANLRRHSRNFTLSPETTDYDSNCGDLDSLSNDINCPTDYGKLYTSMPVLEDGLSSGHASDTDNNVNAAVESEKQILESNSTDNGQPQVPPTAQTQSLQYQLQHQHTPPTILQNNEYTANLSLECNDSCISNSIAAAVVMDDNLISDLVEVPDKINQQQKQQLQRHQPELQVRSHELIENDVGCCNNNGAACLNTSNELSHNDSNYDAVYAPAMTTKQSPPPPPASAAYRQCVRAKQQRESADIQEAMKEIRSALQRAKTQPEKLKFCDEVLPPDPESPVWVPRKTSPTNTSLAPNRMGSNHLNKLHGGANDGSANVATIGDEEEPDTDLETDRLLGQQRLDEQGYYDDKAIWPKTSRIGGGTDSNDQSPSTSDITMLTTNSVSIKPQAFSSATIRQGIGTALTPSSPEQCQIVGNADITLTSPEKLQYTKSPTGSMKSLKDSANSDKKAKARNKEGLLDPAVLIEGVLFRARYLGSTQLVCEGQPTKSTRMMQAEEAVSRIKAPEGESQPSTEVDLFISTEKIMVLNTDLKEIMMDHALRTISYIADIGDLVVLMARRRFVPSDSCGSDADVANGCGNGNKEAQENGTVVSSNAIGSGCGSGNGNGNGNGNGGTVNGVSCSVGNGSNKHNRTPKMICHVFESDEAQFIAQSIGQAFQVAYMEFLKANGIEDHSFVKEMDYQEVLNSQEIFGDELEIFAKKELQKEVVVPKVKGEILGVVIVESGWGSMLPTVVIANLMSAGAAARCGQLNIGDQLIAINGMSLVGLPLSTCQSYIRNAKNQTAVKFTVVPCPPVVEVKIKRPNTKYQLGFSVQNGVICSLLRGGIAERGGVRVGHRIIEINNQSVVAVPHEKIVNLLATSVGEILMKTMPTSMFRLLTGQENPIYI